MVGATYPYGRYKKEKEGGIGERTYMGRSLLKNLLQSFSLTGEIIIGIKDRLRALLIVGMGLMDEEIVA